ncbi:MAG: TrkH family potassium uptake protein [Eubacteriales bacterium]
MNMLLLEAIWGRLLTAYGIFMCIPLSIAIINRESSIIAFVASAGLSCFIGILFMAHGRIKGRMGAREGFAVVGGAWILASLFGSFPLYISGSVNGFIDAFFETVSGLTTTGASVLSNLESLPGSLLLWRSMTHWIGGMGIIVLFIVLLPNIGIGAVQLFNAEVPGLMAERLFPKIRDTAMTLWGIYTGFTVLEIILLKVAGMSFFDAVNHSFATMATGGFSTRSASIAAYDSLAIELVIVLFMVIAGVNFRIYFQVWRKGALNAFKDTEFKAYILLLSAATLAITVTLFLQGETGLGTSLRQAVFQVVSITTTTGFATADYDQWPSLAKIILFFLMFIGGSAGSTAGGIKVTRVVVLMKMGWAQLRQAIHPRVVVNIVVQDKSVETVILNTVARFFFLFILVFVTASVLLAATGLEPFDAMTAVIATLGNVGPGFGVIGPTATYASITIFGKIVLSICMLLGRLELFTLLVLLQPEFWKLSKKW